MEKQINQNGETIKMVEQSLKVLDLLRSKREPVGVNEIAKMCGLNPSTTFRILKTFEQSGWVFQFNDRRYITGQKISFVTEKNNLYLALREVAQFVMAEYTEKSGQAMNLLVREGEHCTILQQSRTKKFIDYIPPLFSNLPIYASAGGKILLSELPINLVDQVINSCDMKPLTSHTITDPKQFWQVLLDTAKQGYAIDYKESAENGCCIGVPVRDHEGTIIAALSYSGFIGIEDTQELLNYLPLLHEASEKISHSLYTCWEW
jgi:DNA-binding IclR family transcriptional regulator